MNCLIVDNDETSRTFVKGLISLDSSLVLVAECINATDALEKIRNLNINLIFLETSMPGISGLEFAEMLEGRPQMVIFTSTLAEHALEAFDLNAIDYLLKPITPVRFLKAIEKARILLDKKQNAFAYAHSEFTFIRNSNKVHRLKITDILYIEAAGDYVKVYMDGCYYEVHSSLKVVEEKLPQHIFLRIHRSFMVNVDKIDGAEGKILIVKGSLLPVSEAYRHNLVRYMKYL